MSDQKNESLYTRQLTKYLQHNTKLRIFLTTGIGLVGNLLDFDEESIVISSGESEIPSLIMRDNVLSLSDSRLSSESRGPNRDRPRNDHRTRDSRTNYDEQQPKRNY